MMIVLITVETKQEETMERIRLEEPKAIYTSPTGVEYEIVHVEQTALYGVIPCKGGAKPLEFEGMFTSPQKARQALEIYFNRVAAELPKEEPKVAKKA